jgi:tuftelin-interacting protein 11
MWKKKQAAQRVKREFRTAEEVLREAAEKPLEAPRQAILDMRGPQVTSLAHACTRCTYQALFRGCPV